MNYVENLRYFVVFGIVFLVLYIFLAIKPLSTELQITSESSISAVQTDSKTEEITITDGEEALPFRLAHKAGYFTQDGRLIFSKDVPYKATLSNSLWAFYDNDAEAIQVFTPDNKPFTVMNGNGFPFFQEDRMYLLPPGGNSAAEYTKNGTTKWLYEGFTPITAFNSSAKGVVIGFADGNLVCLSPEGNEQFSFYPGGSKYQIILGADIATSANLAACVSGIEKQRFVLVSYENKQHKIIYHEFLDADQKEQTFVKFSKDSKTVYFQSKDGLGAVNCEKHTCKHIPLAGSIRQIEEMPTLNLTVVLTQHNGLFYVYFLENTNKQAGSFSFKAESACITTTGTNLFVGKDTTISKLHIERK